MDRLLASLPIPRDHVVRNHVVRNRGGNATVVLIVGLLAMIVVGLIAWAMWPGGGDAEDENMILTSVIEDEFKHIVIAQGDVESANNVEIRCEVKSRNGSGTVILDVVPEGTRVVKDDWLVRLDGSALEQEMLQQQIICNTSKAIMIQAQNIYEAAIIAHKEYTEGTFRQEEQQIQSELFVAQENLRRSRQYAKYSERLAAKGYVTSLQLEGDRFAVDRSQNELETANVKLNVLREYTKEKMLKTFTSDIATAEAKWKAEQNSYQLELDKLSEVEEQISKCEILAPQAGTVVYANEYSRHGNSEFMVEPGAQIRERQVIIRLPDPHQMQIKAKVNESRITMVKADMPVNIKFDASANATVGSVVKVNQYAEPRGWSSGPVSEYATFVKIDDAPDVIRAGMTAEVQILVNHIPSARQIPVEAVMEYRGRYFALVKTSTGWQTPEVKVGPSNDKFIVVESGLTIDDVVVMNPRAYRHLLELPDIPEPEVKQQERGLGGSAASGKRSKGGAGRPSGGSGKGRTDGGRASDTNGSGQGPKKSDATKSDATKSDATKSDTTKSDATKSDATKSGAPSQGSQQDTTADNAGTATETESTSASSTSEQ
ncbi:MAG: HlyD family secretion protein [Pirellulaceae bacterium]|jgi:HlyD family secretion protein